MERLRFVWVGEWLQRLRLQAKPPIQCREVVELVTNYLEGALRGAERERFEAHLGACPHCTRYFEQFRQTIQATGHLREEDLQPDAKEALLSAFRTWKAS